MKTVVEIVTAIILLVSGGYLAPKAVESFKKETLLKIQKGLPPLENFSQKLSKPK